MTPTHIHKSDSTYAKRTGTSEKAVETVGILAKLDDNGNIDVCDRWAKPFLARGMDVIYIPVGAKNLDDLLERIDGLLLPGGDSNIHPMFYDPLHIQSGDVDERDLSRDRTAIELVSKAYSRDIPTLGICRGMQEMIVAFGGQLEKLDMSEINHASGYDAPLVDGKRCPQSMDTLVHAFNIQNGGILDGLFAEKTFQVNSIHYEGITTALWDSPRNKRLRNVFMHEALAPDGVVEGISARDKTFFLGLQPHFELGGPLHDTVFGEFYRQIGIYNQKQQVRAQDLTPELTA